MTRSVSPLAPSASLVAEAIIEYQRHISPYKGFCCAHRLLHGGASCSEFARRLVVRRGVAAMTPMLMARLEACRRAAGVLETRNLRGRAGAAAPGDAQRQDSPGAGGAGGIGGVAAEFCGEMLLEAAGEACIE